PPHRAAPPAPHPLGRASAGGPWRDRGLGAALPVQRDGAAVDPPQRTLLLQLDEVAPDGLLRDPECPGQLDGRYRGTGLQLPRDVPMTLRDEHGILRRSTT